MQARSQLAVFVLLAVASLAGCEWTSAQKPPSTTGAVAVIDLDAIARRLGRDKQIADSINQRQSSLNQQLVDLARSYTQQIEEKKKTLPETEADQGKVKVASWQQQANASLNQIKQKAEVDLQSHRAQLISQFRDQIKPAARKVAQARGLSVIVTKNEGVVFDFAARSDITEDVVNELLATQAAPLSSATAPASAPVAR